MSSYSLAALTALELSPPDLIDVASRAGYDAVGLRLIAATPGGVAYPLMEDPPLLRETLACLQATGVKVGDLEILAIRPDTAVGAFEPLFEVGQRLGAKHLLVAGYDPDMSRFIDTYGALCDLAFNYGLTADLEFMPWTNVPDLRSAIDVVRRAGRPNGGVLIDALHFDRSRSSVETIADVPRGSLHYWQFCDAPAERPTSTDDMLHTARAERMFPGEGGIDLVPLVRAMPPDIVISLEVPTSELAKTTPALVRAKHAIDGARRVVDKAMQSS